MCLLWVSREFGRKSKNWAGKAEKGQEGYGEDNTVISVKETFLGPPKRVTHAGYTFVNLRQASVTWEEGL